MTRIRSNPPSYVPPRPKDPKPEAKTDATQQTGAKAVEAKNKAVEAKNTVAQAPTPAETAEKKDAFLEPKADKAPAVDLLRDTSANISAAPTANAASSSAAPEEMDKPLDLAADASDPSPTPDPLVSDSLAAKPPALNLPVEAEAEADTKLSAAPTSTSLAPTSTSLAPAPVSLKGLAQPPDLALVDGARPSVLSKTADTPPAVSAAADPAATSALPSEPLLNGQQRAQQDVDVKTVADDRTETETLQRNIKDGANQKTQEIFSMAEGGTAVPPGVSVTRRGDNEVELVRTDEGGNELERTFAKRNADGSMQLDSRSYKDSTNQRNVVEVLTDGSSSVKSASWQSTENQSAQNTPSFEQLEQSRDRSVKLNEQRIGQKDADGNWVSEGGTLSTDAYEQSEGAVKGSQTSFSNQQGLGGLDRELTGNFSDPNGTVDRATTHTYTIPPPGEDGTQALPEYERIERFSQGDAQATSYVNAELSTDTFAVPSPVSGDVYLSEGDHVDYQALVGTQNHTREDLNKLSSAHTEFWRNRYDGNDADLQNQPHKRWLVENKDNPQTYESQTFVEGAPNATITTRRELQADNTVAETYGGKTFSPDPNSDDLVPVSGSSTTTYGADGQVDQSSFRRQQPDGNIEDGTYNRTREQTAQGLVVSEHSEGNVTQPDGKKSSSIMDRKTREGAGGKELLSSSQDVIEDGKRAHHEVGPDGERMMLSAADGGNPVEITDASQFSQPFEENLMATAASTNLTNVKGLTDAGAIFSSIKEGSAKAQSVLGGSFNEALSKSATAYKNIGLGLGAGGGAIGASAAAASMVDAVRTKNNLAIASASIGLGGSAADMGSAMSVMKGALGKFGGMLGTAGAALGSVSNILGGVDSIMTADKTGLTGQKAKGIANVVTGGLGLAALAAGAPVLALGLGVVGVGINAITELVADDAHQIAGLRINDPNYRPSMEEQAPRASPDEHTEEQPVTFDPAIWNLW